MAQQPIEMILLRQLAGYLSVPVLVADVDGNIVFYNEPAEPIIGLRFDESGRIPAAEAGRLVEVRPVEGEEDVRPLEIALRERRPAHSRRRLRRHGDGTEVVVALTAFPLIGLGGASLGAVAMFWEEGRS